MSRQPEIRLTAGQITAIGNSQVSLVQVPDWNLEYIEYPPGEMEDYRSALWHGRVRIVKITKKRIYFEPK